MIVSVRSFRCAIAAAMLVCSLALPAAGCANRSNPVVPPADPGIHADYSDPDQTLETIARAVRDKARTNGSSVYIDSFADSTSPTTPAYHHFFWPTDVIDTGITPPADWSILEERNFYTKLANLRGDEYRLIWGPDDASGSDEIGVRTAVIHRHYLVITETADGTSTGTIALGFATLTLVKGADGNWRIFIWSDRVDPTGDVGVEEVTLGRRRLTSQ